MRHANLMGAALVLGGVAGLVTPQAVLADDVTLNVPVQLSSLATAVTRGQVACQIRGEWEISEADRVTAGTARAQEPFQATGASEFTIDSTSGEYNGTSAVRISTPAPPQAWRNAATLKFASAPRYFCSLKIAAANDGRWAPAMRVFTRSDGSQGAGPVPEAIQFPWAVLRSSFDSLTVSGTLSMLPR